MTTKLFDDDPLAGLYVVTVKRTEEVTGLGHTKVNELISSGRLPSTKIDGRRLVFTYGIRALLAGGA